MNYITVFYNYIQIINMRFCMTKISLLEGIIKLILSRSGATFEHMFFMFKV
jgi:hypothetical protein